MSYLEFLSHSLEDFYKLDEEGKRHWLELKQTYCESIGNKCSENCTNTACYGHPQYALSNTPMIN
jgi:hypothetical protein